MREFSLPALAEIPATANLASTVFRRAAEQPQAVVLRRPGTSGFSGPWTSVTASQFRDEVVALAKGLVAAGIEVGDRVALMSHTRYEWTLIDYAIWTAGAVTVPVYETSSAEQTEWILSDSGATACFAETAAFEDMIFRLRDRLPGLSRVWRIDPGPAAGSAAGSALDGLRAQGADTGDEVITERSAAAKASDLATVIYTSGTTGRPKGCELTHANMLADVRNAFHGPLAQLTEIPDTSTLLFLPLAHVFARIIQVGCLEGGVVLGHCGDLSALLPALASFRPTFILAVPRVFEKVFNSAEQKAASDGKGAIFGRAAETAIAWSQALDGPGRPPFGLRAQHLLFDRLVYGKLRAALGGQTQYAVSGGAALSERLSHFFRGIGVTVLEGYGLTETTAAATVNRPDRVKIGTVGLPLPGVSIRIDEDGEILIKGVSVFPGYWRNEAATSEVFTEDAWFRTGDIGELDDEGFLKITGRKKEMIVTASGKNVAPAVLEDRIRSHALVSQAMVVGDDRPFVAALITLDDEAFGLWKARNGKRADATIASLRDDPDLVAAVQVAIDDANQAVSRAESIKKFRILDVDFTQEAGQLSVKLGIRRSVLLKDFATEIDALYS
ncbi:MAG TPA: long-chain fatty acid--CoA ligase [Streptosporangiaceae bacterium]|nr:long-chain fatty acid--CoA ligase [Streptosporangiaceae bacterium]